MTKNKWIALVVISAAFLVFGGPAFLKIDVNSPLINLFSFVILTFATLIAIFVGNNESSNNH